MTQKKKGTSVMHSKDYRFAVFDKDRENGNNTSRFVSAFYADKEKRTNVRQFYSIEGIIKYFRRNVYTAIFMSMNGMDEVDAAWVIKQRDPGCLIIIMSECGDYSLEGFRLEAFDYLLHPMDEQKISAVLERLNKFIT
jgi:DNA-binding LytR/AlgR family response regulator